MDPADPERLYLSAWGVTHPDGDTGGGIFLSTDAGATWRNVLPEAQHVYDVTVDPRDPSVLYACGFDQAAFRSADRGETWTRIRGFNFKWGHRVIPDPADAAKIYVTTFGGSVWHGPAQGDPSAIEDVVAGDGPEGAGQVARDPRHGRIPRGASSSSSRRTSSAPTPSRWRSRRRRARATRPVTPRGRSPTGLLAAHRKRTRPRS